MGVDIRLPIGFMFTVFGLLLSAFGLFSDPGLYQRSLGINVNLAWGIVLLIFGVSMFLVGRAGARAAAKSAAHQQSRTDAAKRSDALEV